LRARKDIWCCYMEYGVYGAIIWSMVLLYGYSICRYYMECGAIIWLYMAQLYGNIEHGFLEYKMVGSMLEDSKARLEAQVSSHMIYLLISHNIFIVSHVIYLLFSGSQLPHKIVNLMF